MSAPAVTTRSTTAELSVRKGLIVGSYVLLGALLVWSRFALLGHSFWTDEIIMVRGYVRGGLDVIFTGSALNHQLMALLVWATSSVTGDSEIAFRLLSVLPFVAGVVLMTAWLHRRYCALSGILFLFLSTVSPLLLDITRQARGYGLAFMAMCTVIVAALEAVRTRRTWLVVAMCAAGVIGSWTLPQFAIAFGATCVAVALERSVRRATVVGLVTSMALIYAWYAAHSGAVESASQIEDGVRIGLPWIVSAPIDQILLPALLWIDGTALVAGLVWVPLVCAVIVIAASSPLLRVRSFALVLGSGVVASILVLWVTDAYVIPRYLSFLLVPWFVVVATGAATLLSGGGRRRAPVRSVLCLIVLAVLAARFAVLAPDVVALPREANRDAADVIDERGTSTPVVAYMRNPANLVFYLERPVEEPDPETLESRVCDRDVAVYYVYQPFALDDVDIPCLERPGVEHHRLRQYARGDEMNLWFVPPRR